MLKIILLTLILGLSFSCSKKGKKLTSTKIYLGRLSGIASAGGAMVMVRSKSGEVRTKVAKDELELALPNGEYEFFALAWAGDGLVSGDKNLTGDHKCGYHPPKKLEGGEESVSITISTSDCSFNHPESGKDLSAPALMSADQFWPVAIRSCHSVPNSPISSDCTATNQGKTLSFRVSLPEMEKKPGEAPKELAQGIRSRCIDNADFLDTKIKVPVGNLSGGIVPIKMELFSGLGCNQGDFSKAYVWTNGLKQPSDFGGKSRVISISTNVGLFLEDKTSLPPAPAGLTLVNGVSPSSITTPLVDVYGVATVSTVTVHTNASCNGGSQVGITAATGTTKTVSVGALVQGDHDLYAKQTVLGIPSSCSPMHIDYTVDTATPTVTSFVRQTPSAQDTNAASLTFRVTFSESLAAHPVNADFGLDTTPALSFVSIIPVGSNTDTYDITYAVSGTNGNSRIKFYDSDFTLSDLAGNKFSGFVYSESYIFDDSAPSLSIGSVANITTLNEASYPFNGTCSENGRVVNIEIDSVSSSYACASSTWLKVLNVSAITDGVRTMTVSTSDVAGNVTTVTHNYTVDTVAPSIVSATIFSNNPNPARAKTGDLVTVVYTLDQSVSTSSVTIQGNAASMSGSGAGPYTGTYTLTGGDTQGTIIIAMSATDTAGNPVVSNAVTDASSVTFDKQVPTMSLVYMESNNPKSHYFVRNGAEVYLHFVASEAITATVSIDGNNITPLLTGGVGVATYTAPGSGDRVLPIVISYNDLSGNPGVAATTVTTGQAVTLDNTPPSGTLSLVSPAIDSDNKPDFNVNYTESAPYRFFLNKTGGCGGPTTTSPFVSLGGAGLNHPLAESAGLAAAQTVTYSVRMNDLAGHSVCTNNVTYTFNNKPDLSSENAMVTIAEGTTITFSKNVLGSDVDSDGETLHYSCITTPTSKDPGLACDHTALVSKGVTFNSVTGEIGWLPNYSAGGVYEFLVTATDGVYPALESVPAEITVTVAEGDRINWQRTKIYERYIDGIDNGEFNFSMDQIDGHIVIELMHGNKFKSTFSASDLTYSGSIPANATLHANRDGSQHHKAVIFLSTTAPLTTHDRLSDIVGSMSVVSGVEDLTANVVVMANVVSQTTQVEVEMVDQFYHYFADGLAPADYGNSIGSVELSSTGNFDNLVKDTQVNISSPDSNTSSSMSKMTLSSGPFTYGIIRWEGIHSILSQNGLSPEGIFKGSFRFAEGNNVSANIKLVPLKVYAPNIELASFNKLDGTSTFWTSTSPNYIDTPGVKETATNLIPQGFKSGSTGNYFFMDLNHDQLNHVKNWVKFPGQNNGYTLETASGTPHITSSDDGDSSKRPALKLFIRRDD